MPRRTLIPLDISPRHPMPGAVVHVLEGRTMGTTWAVKFASLASLDVSVVEAGILRRLEEVVRQMSTWEPTSDLCRFNSADAGSWERLPSPMFEVLRFSLQVAEQSGGAFDPSAGALVDAWGFGPAGRFDEAGFERPTAAALDAARARSGWRRIALDADTASALQPGAASLDLSAVAKGFAVDHVADYLHHLGIEDCLIEIGGELRGDGIRPDGQPWWVALEEPTPPGPIDEQGASTPTTIRAGGTLVALHNLSVATSGDYRRYFTLNGVRYSHSIDPRSGCPVEHDLASVTVLHRHCMAADAWSTALGVMGVEAGLAHANEHRLAALFVSRCEGGFEERLSHPMQALLA